MFSLSYQRPVDSKFNGSKPPCCRWGQRWRLSQAQSKAKDDRQTPGNAADDMGCLPQGLIDKAVAKFPKSPKALKLRVDIMNIVSEL